MPPFCDFSSGIVQITEEQWIALMRDREILTEDVISVLGLFYASPNHAATMSELSIIDGKHYNYYKNVSVSACKKIAQKLELPVMLRNDGITPLWYPVFFLGRNTSDGFEWRLRDELVKALEEVYPVEMDKAQLAYDHRDVRGLSTEELERRAIRNQGGNISYTTSVTQFRRNPEVAEFAKRRAQGKCQLCGQEAPFKTYDGTPYLESHHVVWLAKGGEDRLDNIVALCPNCHRKMHMVDDPADVESLKSMLV